MAKIKTFAAVRPKAEFTEKIAALPYDVYSRKEAREEVKKQPLSFLTIDRGETLLPEDMDIYAPQVYEKARDTYHEMLSQGKFIRDQKKCYYLYELSMGGRTQTGVVACAAVDDYLSGRIRKHENTRAEKEEDRVQHVDALSAQTGPIFLAYRRDALLDVVFADVKKQKPVFDFTRDGGIRHRGFCIDDPELIETITERFASIEDAYIADGHHRAASAVRVAQRRREMTPDYTGEEEFNYFLSVFFPDAELQIFDYNRVLKSLGEYTEDAFLSELSKKFSVTQENAPVHPDQKGEFGLYLPGRWFRLRAKDNIKQDDPVEGLDVALLQREVLAPLFGISNPRTDERIDFVGGIRGLSELERRVESDCRAAFSMYPTSMEELFRVADAEKLMPPKSTWFEPKLLSGLFIHEIER